MEKNYLMLGITELFLFKAIFIEIERRTRIENCASHNNDAAIEN